MKRVTSRHDSRASHSSRKQLDNIHNIYSNHTSTKAGTQRQEQGLRASPRPATDHKHYGKKLKKGNMPTTSHTMDRRNKIKTKTATNFRAGIKTQRLIDDARDRHLSIKDEKDTELNGGDTIHIDNPRINLDSRGSEVLAIGPRVLTSAHGSKYSLGQHSQGKLEAPAQANVDAPDTGAPAFVSGPDTGAVLYSSKKRLITPDFNDQFNKRKKMSNKKIKSSKKLNIVNN